MARKPTGSARAEVPSPARAKSDEGSKPKDAKPAAKAALVEVPAPATEDAAAGKADPAPTKADAARAKKLDAGRYQSAVAAHEALLERGAALAAGAASLRSDPLEDAQAARALAKTLAPHAVELARRGLSPYLTEAALLLAGEIESHLQSLGAATMAARGRSADAAELLADAAQSAHAVREAIARVTRGPDGRKAAHAYGLGEAFSARQPAHVLRALRRIAAAAKSHPDAAADAGLLADDLTTLKGLADELASVPGAEAGDDASERLHRAHAALRAYFDLVAAKATLGLAGDPAERTRVLALMPRGHERRRRG